MNEDFEHPIASGCVGLAVVLLIAAAILFCIAGSLATQDHPGRCDYEPGPNGVKITYCEPDN